MTALIVINDADITIWHQQSCCYRSSAHAVLSGDDNWLFGSEARSRSRLNPRQSFDRQWLQLDQQALHRPAGQARSHADIVWLQCQQMAGVLPSSVSECVLAVPLSFGEARLSLLLGVMNAAGLKVSAALEMAALAASGFPEATTWLEIDTHQWYWQQLSADDSEVYSLDAHLLSRRGLLEAEDAVMQAVAAVFLQSSRYDPLREAQTEQQLYDALPSLMSELGQQATATVSLRSGEREYHAKVDRLAVDQALQPWRDAAAQLLSRQQGLCLVPESLQQLPTLLQSLAGEFDLQIVDGEMLWQLAQSFADQVALNPDEPQWIERLPLGANSRARAAGSSDNSGRLPATHVLFGDEARRLPEQSFELGGGDFWPGDDASRIPLQCTSKGIQCPLDGDDVWVNGRRLQANQLLFSGDELVCGDRQYRLIRCYG